MRWFWSTSLLVLVVVTLLAWVGWNARQFLTQPVDTGHPVTVIVPPGASLSRVADLLVANDVFANQRSGRYFTLFARYKGAATRLRSGEYVITSEMTPVQILHMLVVGDVRPHRLTVIDGWTFQQLRRAVAANNAIKHTLQGKTDAQVMAAIGAPDKASQGEFLPETYLFPLGTTDVEVLRRCYQAMQKVLQREWAQRAKNLPFDSPYQALILASIVERETAAPKERARVAGVFVRRLRIGMRLQSDPTVIYGLDHFNGNLTRADLRHDTPYNTYTRAGLPPTPIALPSPAAIHAALHPAKGDALYFVARGDGTHVFSATLAQHNAAVRKYQLNQ